MHILIAPNAFKNSLNAAEAATAIKDGLLESNLICTCECFPVGDGGDGTAELIIQHCKGVVVTAEVHDPLGRKISSFFGLIDDGKTAVIEMANASGLRLLKPGEFNPLLTNSYGTGELVKQALNNEINKIILCIGGSATVDGATGMLRALGIRFLNSDGKELINLPEKMTDLERIDFSGLDKRIMNCKLIVLCDVENVLLGIEGAASVFGPQKGASRSDVIQLELALTHLRDVVIQQTKKDMSQIKHGGAAGGVGAGLAALLNAELVNGIEHFLLLTKFDDALKKASLVITGEGSIDLQTLRGKGPFGVAKMAKEKGIKVIGLAGKVPLNIPALLQQYFDMLLSINQEPLNITEALLNTRINLKRTAKILGNQLAIGI
ncbi:MAG: glycerate kinase [Sphingobacteriales bacterium]